MKDFIKLLAGLVSGGIFAITPAYLFYLFWEWSMTLVPVAHEFAGMMKLGITVVLFATGGFAIIGGGIAVGIMVGSLVIAFLFDL